MKVVDEILEASAQATKGKYEALLDVDLGEWLVLLPKIQKMGGMRRAGCLQGIADESDIRKIILSVNHAEALCAAVRAGQTFLALLDKRMATHASQEAYNKTYSSGEGAKEEFRKALIALETK